MRTGFERAKRTASLRREASAWRIALVPLNCTWTSAYQAPAHVIGLHLNLITVDPPNPKAVAQMSDAE